ncbi:uncharacterized protein LOC108097044 [Drosophila ficusphila]|uniref:uncharacterized protein LOC108097044 n=1 Tax=Drosophila ficusphila TaxID=30025 RepID=UPI0007E7FEB4|nr:uncharacterized protein LOC108097044 [Drosophila ficusphila]XP_017054566.1 uncharacterized protein LOC108097044 [Drosophila ficusphila]
MFSNSFYKMKNFANPKTMFKSCTSKEDCPTQSPQKVAAAPVAVPQAAALPPQSAEIIQQSVQSTKTQTAKNALKKTTTPQEPPKQGKNKAKKGKKNQKNMPRTSSQTSTSSIGQIDAKKNQVKNGKSKDKEFPDKEKAHHEQEKLQEKLKAIEKEKLLEKMKAQEKEKKSQEKKLLSEKSVEKKRQDKRTSEQKLLEMKIQNKLSQQKIPDSLLEPQLYQSTIALMKSIPRKANGATVLSFPEPLDVDPLSDISEENSMTEGKANDPQESEENEEPEGPQHPLNSCWTLWYLENDRAKSWEDMLHEVTSVETVENFWSLVNHIKQPSDLKMGSDYCLFKKGIRPMWEDAANVHGGRWVITLSKTTKADLDNFWMDSMLCLIGEACDYSDELCGAVVNIRGKTNKISIWTADGGNEEAVLEIGRRLREGLRMESAYVLQYQLHKDTKVKQGSTVKSIYTL